LLSAPDRNQSLQPYRGTFGAARPARLSHLTLPPAPMPSRHRSRPLKAWRYVGVFGPQMMLCLAQVRVGPGRQSFWAVWDRARQRLDHWAGLGAGGLRLGTGMAQLHRPGVRIDLVLEEVPGVEVVCPAGASYGWTRKQADIPAHVMVQVAGTCLEMDARAVIDDTAAYYARHTHWQWCAGVGVSDEGRSLAWNLVSGVNDPPKQSERTLWVDGQPREVPPCSFSEDLTRIEGLTFSPEATLAHRRNLGLVRSAYRQPFGTFSGRLPGGFVLAEGYGVTEDHDAWW
jgi:hypothetical protein